MIIYTSNNDGDGGISLTDIAGAEELIKVFASLPPAQQNMLLGVAVGLQATGEIPPSKATA